LGSGGGASVGQREHERVEMRALFGVERGEQGVLGQLLRA
jgi:hypothetical protein